MIPLSKILFFVLLIILLVLVALLITSLSGGFSRCDEYGKREKQIYNYLKKELKKWIKNYKIKLIKN